ncbi:MAG: endolytic transglycosylase MltG [Deltaproteobacteria bacterium HGW-Deltaproteobacteria-17]|jgi:UPF0755 protein|nr:MAG: endolytic transglycosylase MltG [Deltaproteobacteria bacterium HGW-Deltaproteobacteria-17]
MISKKNIALIVTGLTLLVAVAGLFTAWRWFAAYPHKRLSDSTEIVEIEVPRGAAFSEVVRLLYKNKLIEKPTLFRLYTMWEHGSITVQQGSYQFRRDDTPAQIITKLKAGPKLFLVSVTIPEGKHHLEVAKLLADAGVAPEAELIAGMKNEQWLRELDIKAPDMEGYLFPETYRFRKNTPVKKALFTLVGQHKKVWSQLIRTHQTGLRRLQGKFNFNSHQIVIMASLVEKETGVSSERPLIAGVFFNRLSLPGFPSRLLQTDPTIIYGCTVAEPRSAACREFTGRIRRIHLLDKDNLYSTYTHPGLPPGPICNPGRASLTAVFAPSDTKYLFFVAKTPGGEHQFSATMEEHQKAVDKYILKKGND